MHDESLADNIRSRLNKPIVLIGMMGVGKTRLGRMLARSLDLDFIDSDLEIEKAAGMSVAEIFERFGEPYFRDGEHRVLERLLNGRVKVVATGGGAVMHGKTAEILWNGAITIWIKADLDIMVERTGRSDKRPLLQQGDPEEILRELAEKRYPVYGRADITIESHKGPIQAVLNRTLSEIDVFLRQKP